MAHYAFRLPRARYVRFLAYGSAFAVLGCAVQLRRSQVAECLGDLMLALVTAMQVDQRSTGDQGGAYGAAGPASAPGSALGEARPAHTAPRPEARRSR
jgi:hypothetical protein